MPTIRQLLITCPLVFIAGFIDSIAGGGGLISLPSYFIAGLPPHLALGTNKLSSCIGTSFSTAAYMRGGFVDRAIIPVSVAGALIGSWIGARFVLLIDDRVLRWIMIVLLPLICIFTIFKKDLFAKTERDMSMARVQLSTAIITLSIGFYDGFFGPGAGMFLILAFAGILYLDPVTAGGNAKIVNLSSNIAALATFALHRQVLYALALPCAAFSVLGNLLGSKLAIKNGAKIIKPFMIVVVVLLLITIIRDLISFS